MPLKVNPLLSDTRIYIVNVTKRFDGDFALKKGHLKL